MIKLISVKYLNQLKACETGKDWFVNQKENKPFNVLYKLLEKSK